MIRAVIDTNILIRALIKPRGSVGPILTKLRAGDYQLVYSPALLSELSSKLILPRIRGKYHLSQEDIEVFLALLLLRGEPVIPQRTIQACRDPKDNMVLEAAVAGQAQYIVTGDEDLLVLKQFEGIVMAPPRLFLERLG